VHIYLYYKERRQLTTFLTQFRLTLPLTPDPHVICFFKVDRVEGLWSTKKSQFGERFYQNHNVFITHPDYTCPRVPARPTYPRRCAPATRKINLAFARSKRLIGQDRALLVAGPHIWFAAAARHTYLAYTELHGPCGPKRKRLATLDWPSRTSKFFSSSFFSISSVPHSI
jgi:hypothetical protein